MALMETPTLASWLVCRDCRWAECKFRVSLVRSWLIAYREATKRGDDPADYIRDAIKPSRHVGEDEGKQITDTLVRSTRPADRHWHVEVKVSLEQARAAGLSLDARNAENVARWLCARAAEVPVDNEPSQRPQ